jgi:nitrogen-specific signal transduction histidine kinase
VSVARRQQQLCTPRRSRDAIDHELHETVVQKNPIAGLHHARQLLESSVEARCASPTMSSLVNVKCAPWQKLNRFRIDFSQPQFRSRKICHDRDAPAGLRAQRHGCAE